MIARRLLLAAACACANAACSYDGEIDPPVPIPPPAIDGVVYALPAPVDRIDVDASLGDWSEEQWFELTSPDDYYQLAGPVADPVDLRARFALRWNRDALLVAVLVHDDVFANGHSRDILWQGDSVQVAFDVASNGGMPYDDSDDFEYGWALTAGGLDQYCWKHPGLPPSVSALPIAVAREADVTTYEARISAADLGVDGLEQGEEIGFTLIVNDDDNDGTARSGYVYLTRGLGDAKNPGLFDRLVLWNPFAR